MEIKRYNVDPKSEFTHVYKVQSSKLGIVFHFNMYNSQDGICKFISKENVHIRFKSGYIFGVSDITDRNGLYCIYLDFIKGRIVRIRALHKTKGDYIVKFDYCGGKIYKKCMDNSDMEYILVAVFDRNFKPVDIVLKKSFERILVENIPILLQKFNKFQSFIQYVISQKV